jgi:PPOX class probable F420-dependent enzyme
MATWNNHFGEESRGMALEIEPQIRRFIESHRVAHLATANAHGRPSVIPICYAFPDAVFYSVIDEKPKTVSSNQLQRIQNIRSNPNVALVIDDYSEDWEALAYLHVRCLAEILEPGTTQEHSVAITALRARYPQYSSMHIDARPIIKLVPQRVRFWSAQ